MADSLKKRAELKFKAKDWHIDGWNDLQRARDPNPSPTLSPPKQKEKKNKRI